MLKNKKKHWNDNNEQYYMIHSFQIYCWKFKLSLIIVSMTIQSQTLITSKYN